MAMKAEKGRVSIMTKQQKKTLNLVLTYLVIILIGCVLLFPALQLDKIMIGYIMLLIPGLAMTNSVRDILVGNTISGALLLTESLLWAGALASGFMLAIWITGV